MEIRLGAREAEVGMAINKSEARLLTSVLYTDTVIAAEG